MDRLLTQVSSRSLIFLSPIRSLSSFKSNTIDLKSRALLNQTDKLKSKTSISISNIDLIYEHNPLFPLPGRIGFVDETKIRSKFNPNLLDQSFQGKEQQLITKSSSIKNDNELLSKLINNNNNLEIRTYDCSSTLRSNLQNLFLNYNTLTQPLTAIIVVFKTKFDMSIWSNEIEKERNRLANEFTKLAYEISNYLNSKQYWVDFIDPSNGKPYYGPPTSDTLFETDERLRHFGIDIIDLGCCRIIEHLIYGTHVFVGCIFTSAPKIDANVQYLLKEFDIPNYS